MNAVFPKKFTGQSAVTLLISTLALTLITYCRVSLGADDCPCSGTVTISPTVPTIEKFDTYPSCTLDGLSCSANCTIPGTWSNIPNGHTSSSDDIDWIIRSGHTPTERTGPSKDVSGTGKYIYLESSCTDVGNPDKQSYLQSKCLNFQSVISPELLFSYHMYGEEAGDIIVEASTDSCLSWQPVGSIKGPQQTASEDPWKKATVNLSNYRNRSNVRLRFRGVTGKDQYSDIALDELTLKQSPQKDLAVTEIIDPITNCGLTSSQTVSVLVENLGYEAQSNFPIKYQVGGESAVTETFSGTIAPGSQIIFSFNTKANLSAAGSYPITSTVLLPGDTRSENDSVTQAVENIPVITSYPYMQTFESGTGGWIASGQNSSWAFGTPNKTVIKTAGSGANSWVTGGLGTGNYRNSESSQVVGPCFNFSALKFPVVGLKSWWNAEGGYDGAVLQSSINNGQSWQRVGVYGDPNNWYTSSSVLSNPGGQSAGWTGSTVDLQNAGSKGWVSSGNFLSGLAGKTNVRLRITFGSDSVVRDDGFAFDDFVVKEGLTAIKTVAFTIDQNNNGFADPGDQLEYSIVLTSGSLRSISSIIFDDIPDSNTTLVVGSVTTTRGTVSLGNKTGNTTVRINSIPTFSSGATATIKFKVNVKATFSGSKICNQGSVTSNSFSGSFLTDNPSVGGVSDPTCVSCIDTDLDGFSDCIDQCATDPNKSVPGQCGCGTADTDSDGDGTANCNDLCPNDPNKIAPKVCGCGASETDSDNDRTPNCTDGCPNDPLKTAAGVCGCGVADTDSDGDGTPNCNDSCPEDASKQQPGVCGCGTADTDSDSDGVANCNDQCPNDEKKSRPGECGCGTLDTDTDGDGTANCNDQCMNDPLKTKPGQCGCGVADTDSDNDTIPDCKDTCPNGSNVDTDHDGVEDCRDACPVDPAKTQLGVCGCGVADTDSDSDGIANCIDGCPNDRNKTAKGQCGCGVADTDSDRDGTANCNDGCVNDSNKSQPGQCGCGVADTDSDSDGTANCNDLCPNDKNKIAPKVCGCGVAETDSDNDGTLNCKDSCPNDKNKILPGICGCGVGDADSDSDGTPNCKDSCPNDKNKILPGICGCGVADTDSDRDGTANCKDSCPNDPQKTSQGACGCGVPETDSDGDGVPNCTDVCAADPEKSDPLSCGCGLPETDTDSDGTPDCVDQCPNVSFKIAPMQCGCDVPDTDSDGDGTVDCLDNCPVDGTKVVAGVCGCNVPDADSDGDSIPDCQDKCPTDISKSISGVCGCGVSDSDSDNDGAADCVDQCPTNVRKITPGMCGCAQVDVDSDKDGTADCIDECPVNAIKVRAGSCGCDKSDLDANSNGISDCLLKPDLIKEISTLTSLLKKVTLPPKKNAIQTLLRQEISKRMKLLQSFVGTYNTQIVLIKKSKPIRTLLTPVSKSVSQVVKTKNLSVFRTAKTQANKSLATLKKSLG